jgi:hypothetical protein
VTRPREPRAAARPAADKTRQQPIAETREALMARHAAARQRRDSAALGSDEFRQAAEDVARIEIAIAALVERASV